MSGCVELCTGTIICGWAWDSDDPERCVDVGILVNGELITQVAAQQYREDLKTAGIGDGRHGFSYVPPSSIDTKNHQATVFIVGTDVELPRLPSAPLAPPLMARLGPIAPGILRQRIAGTQDEPWFNRSGALTVGEWIRLLGCLERRIGEFDTIVDWGCGCGRALRHLALRLTVKQRLIGADVDAEAINWVRENYPEITTLVLDETPPSPLVAESVDLIVSNSIFTHLPEDIANLWLSELARILKAGGILITTVHGARAVELQQNWLAELKKDTERAEFLNAMKQIGFYYFPGKPQPEAEAPLPEYYGSAFHTIDYIERKWTERFLIRAWFPTFALSYQDTLVLEKKQL